MYTDLRQSIKETAGSLTDFATGYTRLGFTKDDTGAITYREWLPPAQSVCRAEQLCLAVSPLFTCQSLAKYGCGSKPCTSGEHQNRWYMGVHPPQHEAIGYDLFVFVEVPKQGEHSERRCPSQEITGVQVAPWPLMQCAET